MQFVRMLNLQVEGCFVLLCSKDLGADVVDEGIEIDSWCCWVHFRRG